MEAEALLARALQLFLSMESAEEEEEVHEGLAPDSWCFTSIVDAAVRGGRPNLALLLIEKAYLQV